MPAVAFKKLGDEQASTALTAARTVHADKAPEQAAGCKLLLQLCHGLAQGGGAGFRL